VYGEANAIFRDDLLSLHIEGLADYVGGWFAQSAFSCNVDRHLDFCTVGEGVQAGIENIRRTTELNLEGPARECCDG
jgi:hypothetical protein